ncbi:MAG TPA: hypothetical protein PKD19_00740 [Candidatus Saccharibacteria bacterium]|nr:hypothetical protein [Candidatus Saccharibacteria bacterium]HMR38240.1 hypothetical protein [Candidatus Saccharibacteria bacterium]
MPEISNENVIAPGVYINPAGSVVRSGPFRIPRDPNAGEYAKKAAQASPSSDCIFCPREAEKRKAWPARGYGAELAALPPYGHFAGYRVARHHMMLPREHTESMWSLDKYDLHRLIGVIASKQAEVASGGGRLLSYARSPDSLSKTVPHLHTHKFELLGERLVQFTYSTNGGVLDLETEPSPINTQVMDDFYGGSDASPVGEPELAISDQFKITTNSKAWSHFDGQKVVGHETITMIDEERPFAQLLPNQMKEYFDYLCVRNRELDKMELKDRYTQDFPFDYSAMGFKASLLTLGYEILTGMSMRDGVTKRRRFIRPTDDQIALINERQKARSR